MNKEIALPLDEVLAGASVLLEKLHGADPEATAALRRMLDAARQVKDSVSRVGRNMTEAPRADGEPPAARQAGAGGRFGRADAAAGPPAPGAAGRRRRDGRHAAPTGSRWRPTTDYDAIFQEVKPPDMGGYECYRRLRAARPTAVVSLTTGFGYDAAHSIVKARADGMKHVLFKPFRQDQVVKAVLNGRAVPKT